jgi:hypothetical protein
MTRTPRLLLGLLSIALLTVAACGGGGDEDPAPKDGHYENRSVRYFFDYPAEWPDVTDTLQLTFNEGQQATVLDSVVVGNVEDEIMLLNGVQVTVVQVNAEVTDENRASELLALDPLYDQLASQAAGGVTAKSDVELGGLAARQYVVEFVYANQVQAASVQTVTFFGDRQYIVNCQGRADTFDEEVLPGCEQALQSFRFR